MEFSYYLIQLRKKWKYFLLTAIIASSLTFVLVSMKKKQFYSRAQLSAGITDNRQVSFEKNELSWSDINNMFNNFLEFLNSKELSYMISYRITMLEIENQGRFKPKDYSKLLTVYSQEQLDLLAYRIKEKYKNMQVLDLADSSDAELENLMKAMYYNPSLLRKGIGVSRITGTDYVKVEAKSENPYFSSQLVNIFCEEAIRIHNERELKIAEMSVSFFRQLLDEKKRDFEKKLDSLTRTKAGNDVIDMTSQSSAQIERLSSLENSRNEELQKIEGLRKALASIDRQLSNSEKKAIEENLSNSKIINIKSKIELMNEVFIGSSGSKRKAISDSINNLRVMLEKEINKQSAGNGGGSSASKELMAKKTDYEIELSMSEARLNSLMSIIGQTKATLSKFVGNEASITPLEMSVNLAKEEYSRVVDKYNDAINDAMKKGALIRQIEIGSPAIDPEPTHRVILTAVAGIASMVVVSAIIFGLVFFDNTIKNPYNFENKIGLPLIGFVYKYQTKIENLSKVFFDKVPKSDDETKFKEQLRSIRFEIEKSGARSILFTSKEPGEGKTFIITSLAYSLVLNHRKVLIVDTNFKNNSLTNIFSDKVNIKNNKGINEQRLINAVDEMLSLNSPQGSQNHEEVAEGVALKTGIDGLDIICSKSSNLSPSEMFYDKHFAGFIDVLKNNYDYILMEGPCLNIYSDTKELSVYCDKVVGIFSANKAMNQIGRESIKYLKTLGDKYLGSILNNVDKDDLSV